MTAIVVIDDIRTHPGASIHLRSSREALAWLSSNEDEIDELWLDHDLGGEDTIRSVVHFIDERAFSGTPLKIKRIIVHTASPVGASWIMSDNVLTSHYMVVRGTILPERPPV
jgi:hypothetical protein